MIGGRTRPGAGVADVRGAPRNRHRAGRRLTDLDERAPAAARDDATVDLRIRLAALDREGDAVLAVQCAGYAVEARLIGVAALPPQHETIDDLRDETVWVAEEDGAVVGVLGLEEGDGSRDRAAGRRAAHAAGDRARAGKLRDLAGRRSGGLVGTAAANRPALELYGSLGFRHVAERTVGDGLAYVELRRASIKD